MEDDWQEVFKITYHPYPGLWHIHWKESGIPATHITFNDPQNAMIWIDENYRSLIDEKFEKIVLPNE